MTSIFFQSQRAKFHPLRNSVAVDQSLDKPARMVACGNAAVIFALGLLALFFSGCEVVPQQKILISAADQKMAIYRDGVPIRTFPISTSKFGLGDRPGSYATPLGLLRVKKKIGENVKEGTVFKGRNPTGEVLKVDAPGRDPIVTRILWLEGLEASNKNAFKRYIYIHGTPEERNIGKPVSYGCIRMRSRDIVELFDDTEVNTRIFITRRSLPKNTAMGDRQVPLSQPRKVSKRD